MADMHLDGLYTVIRQQFGVEGAAVKTFGTKFITSVNRSIREINQRANLETPITAVEDVDDTVTGLDEKYEDVLADGVAYNLYKLGVALPAKGAEGLVRQYRDSFVQGIHRIWTDILNDALDDDTDNEDDFIDLGGLGD